LFIFFTYFTVCEAQNITNTWKNVLSLNGVDRPYRCRHSCVMSVGGVMGCFGGLDNYLASVKVVDIFNYVYQDPSTVPAGQVPDAINIIGEINANTSTPSREWAAFTITPSGDMLMYGGDLGGSPSNFIYYYNQTSQTLVHSNTTLQGSQTQTSNHFTFQATGACAAVVASLTSLFIFGGTADIVDINFVTQYNYATNQFIQLNFSGNQPAFPLRQYGSIMSYTSGYKTNGGCLWIFGGKTRPPGQNYTVISTLNVLQISSSTWLDYTQPTGGPAARVYAAGAVLKDGKSWVVFGGVNDNNAANLISYSDLWSFDMTTGVGWVAVTPSGTGPTGRDSLVAVACQWTGEDSILYYGGSDNTGAALNDFWKYEYTTAGFSPTPPPIIPGQDVTDFGKPPTSTTATGNSTKTASSVAPAVKESSAANLDSWLHLFL